MLSLILATLPLNGFVNESFNESYNSLNIDINLIQPDNEIISILIGVIIPFFGGFILSYWLQNHIEKKNKKEEILRFEYAFLQELKYFANLPPNNRKQKIEELYMTAIKNYNYPNMHNSELIEEIILEILEKNLYPYDKELKEAIKDIQKGLSKS